jgi:hydrogenase maturation protein HypF
MAYLWATYGVDWRAHKPQHCRWNESACRVVEGMLDEEVNVFQTSSVGRLFDAVAALALDVRKSTYEGEAPMLLEAAAHRGVHEVTSYEVRTEQQDRVLRVSVRDFIRGVIADIGREKAPERIAFRFHQSLADVVTRACLRICEASHCRRVALSGGSFQNMLLLEACLERLEASGIEVLTHQEIPPNDGCISFGQAAIAAWKYRNSEV